MIVEDGTGLDNSDSYASIAFCDTYFDARGNATWGSASTAEKEIALVKATQFIDTYYTFPGWRLTVEQSLQWPRAYAYDKEGNEFEGIPRPLKQMTAECAVRALTSELQQDMDMIGNIRRERVDGAVEVEYADGGARQEAMYPFIDNIGYTSGVIIGKSFTAGRAKVVRV